MSLYSSSCIASVDHGSVGYIRREHIQGRDYQLLYIQGERSIINAKPASMGGEMKGYVQGNVYDYAAGRRKV